MHSSVDRHLDCSRVLAVINSAAVNIEVHVSLQIVVFSGYMPRSEITGSYGGSIFSFLRILQTILHSDCTGLHSHRQYRRIPFSSQPLKHLLFVAVLSMASLISIRSCLLVVRISVSLIVTLSVFLCAYWSSVYLLWRNVYLCCLIFCWGDFCCYCHY